MGWGESIEPGSRLEVVRSGRAARGRLEVSTLWFWSRTPRASRRTSVTLGLAVLLARLNGDPRIRRETQESVDQRIRRLRLERHLSQRDISDAI